ncbi:MAG TPA: hypothetical protein VD903_15445 [Pseudonocardia sp.]|nr:hypothetical protein [Pseudonocardia sp.]
MLYQLHTVSDISADHRRALLADAEAYRLARTARLAAAAAPRPSARRRTVLGLRRLLRSRATRSPA